MLLYLVCLTYISAFSKIRAAVVTISETWDGNFAGEFWLSADTAASGWRVHLVFSIPITSLQADEGMYVTHLNDGTDWSISGQHSETDLHEGEYVPVSIHGEYNFYDFDEDLWATALIENLNEESSGFSQFDAAIFLNPTQSSDITPTQSWDPETPNPTITSMSDANEETGPPVEIERAPSKPYPFTDPPNTSAPAPKDASSPPLGAKRIPPRPSPSTAWPDPTMSAIWAGPKSCKQLVKVNHPVGSPMKYEYDNGLAYSILFYEAQRSGKLPADNRIPWRGDSALDDGWDVNYDLSGGWYDAGDNVKFGFPMASSTTVLLWGLIQWKDAYVDTGQIEFMYDSVKWPLDYFIKCHTARNELYVQVGDAATDHQYWGRPEDMVMFRPSFLINETYPGSDVAAETAAAMAAGAIVFRERDPKYATELLLHAKELFHFANNFRGIYTDSVPEANVFYESSHYYDELAWAACWLFKATGSQKYLMSAEQFYPYAVNIVPWEFSWDDKRIGVEVMLWNITRNSTYRNDIVEALSSWLPSGALNYTKKGLAYHHRWGSLRYAENGAFIALMAAEYGIYPETYRLWSMRQMHYALGDTGRSFVVGLGKNSPENPHHRASSCLDMPEPCGWEAFNTTRNNPQPLCGALVGGPDENDAYKDDRKDYINNEVACDYNAGYQSALAGLIHLSTTHQLPPNDGRPV